MPPVKSHINKLLDAGNLDSNDSLSINLFETSISQVETIILNEKKKKNTVS
jgi:hypothetical protein